jgi:diketogulonate reductase-like aldo/keto reductase
MTRHEFLKYSAVSASLLATTVARTQAPINPTTTMQKRRIPTSSAKESLPVVGVGTWQTFDVNETPAQREPLAGVLQTLFTAGGSVIDSSPMYGRSEAVTGDLLAHAGTRGKAFIATKVWTQGREAGIAQMEQSMKLLRTPTIDLMQVHNLVDWRTHLKTLRSWKEQGRVRYLGVTHYLASAHAELEAVLKAEPLDFVQLNYAIADRDAAQRLLPLAQERGIAVLINQPFGGGGLLRGLRDKPLPAWAAEIDCSTWAQVLLKFVLAHPAVTCVIPGTSKPEHMRDNAAAGGERNGDRAFWDRAIASSGF